MNKIDKKKEGEELPTLNVGKFFEEADYVFYPEDSSVMIKHKCEKCGHESKRTYALDIPKTV